MNHADTAAELVLGNRNSDYGDPAQDFEGVGLVWTGLLNAKLKAGEFISESDVALMMAGLKLRRHAHKAKADNIVDAHGYLLCLEWIESGKRPTPKAEEVNETLEDVCCGATLPCDRCGKPLPCACDFPSKR